MNYVIFRKIIVGAVGIIASYYASKYLEKFLQEKPLADRMDDVMTKVMDLQDKALDKKNQIVDTAKTLYQKV